VGRSGRIINISRRVITPWLVIEPAKAEYARMAGRLAGIAPVVRIRPGDLLAAPAMLNPPEPSPGFPLQSHIDLVRALFLAAFQAEEPFPQVLSQALIRVYRDSGWELVTSSQDRDGILPIDALTNQYQQHRATHVSTTYKPRRAPSSTTSGTARKGGKRPRATSWLTTLEMPRFLLSPRWQIWVLIPSLKSDRVTSLMWKIELLPTSVSGVTTYRRR
jgi:hypothetical protein